MARISKKEVYAANGIEYRAENGGEIYAPLFGWIKPLLVNGNTKLGKGVYTFSTLAGNKEESAFVNGEKITACGTCPCTCKGCYAKTGNYNFNGVKASNIRKTILSRLYTDFVRKAITAQIKADNIKLCRIHASGDFFSDEYITMWRNIVMACGDCLFWSYTKNQAAESAFDDLSNINIVKSIIKGYGFNFGHCDYILNVYKALKAMGKSVYICRCGIDKNQHCVNCKGCSENSFVLFIEHSTDYMAESDPYFEELKAVIENQ